jgi:hypothetical protein
MEEAWACGAHTQGRRDDDALYDAFHGCFAQSHTAFGGHVLPLHPASQRGVHPVCTDPRKLNAARVEGYHTIERLVGRPLGLSFQVRPLPHTRNTQRHAATLIHRDPVAAAAPGWLVSHSYTRLSSPRADGLHVAPSLSNPFQVRELEGPQPKPYA